MKVCLLAVCLAGLSTVSAWKLTFYQLYLSSGAESGSVWDDIIFSKNSDKARCMNFGKRVPIQVEAITFDPKSAWHDEQDPNEYVVFSKKNCKGNVPVLSGPGTRFSVAHSISQRQGVSAYAR
jgi:hypothetical protein